MGTESPHRSFCNRARLLNVSQRTLQRWRVEGGGPQFIRMGAKSVRYSPEAIERWADDNTFSHRAAELAKHSIRGLKAVSSDASKVS